MEPERLVDNGRQVREVADHVEGRHVHLGGNGRVQFGLKLVDDAGGTHSVEEQCARRVGRRVASCNQLRQRLGCEFLSPEWLALLVTALDQALQEIFPVGGRGVLEARLDTRDGDAREILDRLEALRKEGVREVLGVGLERWKNAERCRNLAATIEDLDGGRVDGRAVGRGSDFGHVSARGEHPKWGSKGQIADYVESKVVEPVEAVKVGSAIGVG